MSDSEYSESLDINGQDESEGNDQQINAQMLQLQQHHHQMLQQQLLLQQQQQHQQQHQGENVKFMEYAGSTSSSGDSSISSTSSDDSDDNETEDTLELAKITNEVLNLPRGLCENSAVFQEFFSLNTWHELPIPVQNHLQQFLPRFNQLLPPQLAAIEQTRTLSMLFNNELSRFGQTPLTTLQQQLEAGNCRPDIIKLRQSIMKSRRREQRFQHCEQLSQVAKQLFLSRQRLLDTAYKSAPDTVIKPSSFNTHQPKPAHLYMDNKLSAMRARKRFHNEISNIAQQLGFQEDLALSADEEDNDCSVAEELKKDNLLQQKSLVDFNEPTKPATSLADRCIYSTVFKKRQDIEDEEAFRLQQKSKQLQLTNRNFRNYLRDHKRRKLTEPTLPEFETSDIRLRDVCARAQMGGNFKKIFAMGKPPGRKPKIMPTLATTATTQPATTIPIINNATTTITNTNIKTATTQPITLTSLPPPPPPKLSEPPALVPIKQTIKKPETYQVVKTNANITTTLTTPTKEQQHHHQHQQQISISSLPLELQHKLQQHHQNSNDNLHLNPLLNVTNHTDNLNLCMDDSSLLAGEHDGFNMLDNEVELQQEEVETFAGTCEETIPAFVIANDVVMPGKNKTNKLANISDTTKGLLTTRNQQLNSITQQPLPKLEPLSRIGDTKPSVKPLLTQKSTINTTTASELIQETHACYFSLIRDFFCSTPNHRMRYDDLRMKIDVWLRNPITALNEWYSLAENWSNLLRSAINFLVGEFPDLPEEYVPYIEHKTQINIYQWIGAGRDSDTRLNELCSLWMEKRKQPNDLHKSSVTQAELKLEISPRNSIESEDSPEGDSDKEGSLSPPPPPPRFPTNWMVRPATLEEISEFQRQERDRFDQPHKAYTYRMFGYESVVGPVKGIYTPLLALSKPRGHSMMVGDRPNFVTILTLVRDATARLPNGEGTRADISELLKCSQYINQDAAENVLQTIVSGALDRMHTEHDPCVRYDPNRKIWIYLHRNRSEGDFERIHQENQCNIGKTKKLTQRKPRPANATSKSINLIDQDHFNILTPSVSYSSSSSNNNGTLLSMPALVPSNPIIVTNQTQRQQQQQHVLQQQQQQQINMNKCPPVPPLKYNIPPSSQQSSNQQQQQQKSLLKTTLRTENKTSTSSSSSAANPATATNISKQYSFQMPQAKNNPQHNTTPIIVATPQGLQTVHVSNATSVMASPATSPQQQQQQNSQQQQTNITAQLAGKRVTLNKPIVINQITQQSPSNSSSQSSSSSPSQPQQQQKIKSPQQVMQKTQLLQNHRINVQNQQQQQQQQIITQQQQHHHHQQQQPSNIIIPLSMANSMNITVNSSEQINTSSSTSHSSSPSPKQNIIRLVPASNVKSTMNSPASTQIVNRQRVLSSQTADRPNTPQHQQQQKLNSGIQLLSNSGNIVTVSSGIVGTGASVTNPAGSIVKMSPQQFVSLQQKQAQQQQQQQHIIVKQTGVTKTQAAVGGSKPQRVILGNTSVMTQSGQGKNIVLQQIPVASSSVVVTPSHTTTITSSTSTISGNKIQTINTTNLTPQQQRILIQNLKQQQQQQQQHQTINQNQIQFKTVQVVQNNTATQQQHNIVGGRSQTITMATQQQQQHPKTLVVVSQDNGTQQHQQQQITRILKSSPQLKSDVTPGSTGTRVITSSSGQIISLDNLIQKQGGTLRITGSGGNTQTIKTNQQHITNIIQKSQLQQQQQQQHHQQKQLQTQQYAIVSVPNSIISLGNNSNFTVGQRIITTQAGISSASSLNTTSLVNIGSTRVTPTPVASSSGTGRVITATAAGTKIITKPTGTSTGNIRVINTVNQTGNISLATLQGKQVVLATGKTMNTISKNQLQAQQTQQQHSIVQTQGGSIVIGGQTVKLQQGNTNIQQLLQKSGNIITTQNPASSQQTAGTPQMQTVIMGNQILRVQQMPQIVSNTNRLSVANTKIISSSDNITATNSNTPKTIFVGTSGQTLRLQSSSASSSQTITNKNIIVQSQQQNISSVKTAPTANVGTTPNRVVLAVQGGGQIFLSPNFQGGNINLKSLQNMKVVSLAQHQASLSKDSSSSTSSSLTSQTTILKASSTPTASDTNV